MLDKMFNYENPVWQFMNRVADLLILNFMFLLFSLPIITIGASYTALTYTLVKVVRKEDTYVWKEFWHSFKTNFKQATLMWLIVIPFIFFLSFDLVMWFNDPTLLPKPLKVTTVIVVFIVASIVIYAFPILSHFENTVGNTLKNGFLVAAINIPYTIYFMVLMIAPIVIVLLVPRMIMGFALFGFSLPALLAAIGWNKIFKKLEPPKEEEEEPSDEWVMPVEDENSEDSEESSDAVDETEDNSEEEIAEDDNKEI